MTHDSHYERIPQVAGFVSLMVALAIVDPLSSYLIQKSVSQPLAAMLTLLVAGTAAYLVEWIIETAINDSAWIRRFFVGSHFIEGTWIDVALEDGRAKYVGIVHIEYDRQRFTFNGEDAITSWSAGDRCVLDPDGYFCSEMTVFDWPNLRHKFSGRNSEAAGRGFHEGYGEVHFTAREDGPPIDYNATFCYLGGGETFETKGWRLGKSDRAKLDNPQTRAEVLLCYVCQAEPRARDVARVIDFSEGGDG